MTVSPWRVSIISTRRRMETSSSATRTFFLAGSFFAGSLAMLVPGETRPELLLGELPRPAEPTPARGSGAGIVCERAAGVKPPAAAHRPGPGRNYRVDARARLCYIYTNRLEERATVELTILGSGSSGNAALLSTERTRLLIDAGLSKRETLKRLEAAGRPPNGLTAIVVSSLF